MTGRTCYSCARGGEPYPPSCGSRPRYGLRLSAGCTTSSPSLLSRRRCAPSHRRAGGGNAGCSYSRSSFFCSLYALRRHNRGGGFRVEREVSETATFQNGALLGRRRVVSSISPQRRIFERGLRALGLGVVVPLSLHPGYAALVPARVACRTCPRHLLVSFLYHIVAPRGRRNVSFGVAWVETKHASLLSSRLPLVRTRPREGARAPSSPAASPPAPQPARDHPRRPGTRTPRALDAARPASRPP